MPMQFIEQPDVLDTTYKAREVEGVLDLYFNRKIGYWLAQVFARLKIDAHSRLFIRCLMRCDRGSPLLLPQLRNKHRRDVTACLGEYSR